MTPSRFPSEPMRESRTACGCLSTDHTAGSIHDPESNASCIKGTKSDWRTEKKAARSSVSLPIRAASFSGVSIMTSLCERLFFVVNAKSAFRLAFVP